MPASPLSRLLPAFLLLAAGLALPGCATPPPADDPDALAEFKEANDPLEPTNRALYAVNDVFDTVFFRPAAKAYVWLLPQEIRNRTHNVLVNALGPVTFANDVLQGQPRRAGDSLMRFVVNSTVGVGGIFDVATDWGWPYHETDFGLTMDTWGISEGPYLFLPILGPTNPRDSTGFAVDAAINPTTWIARGQAMTIVGYTRLGLTALDKRSEVLDTLDRVKEQALDPYATIRSLARQNRQSKEADNRDTRPPTIPAWFPRPQAPAAAAP